MSKYVVSASPHMLSSNSTKRIMLDVIIALMPAMLAAILIFGFYSLMIVLLAVGGAVLGEFLYNRIRKKEQTIRDLSAVVTGILLGFNLPVTVPFYVPLIGGFFATMLVKMLFGGLGKNFANPAITARIFLLLAWTGFMTNFVEPIDLGNGFAEMFKYFNCFFTGGGTKIDAFTSATPLVSQSNNLLNMFLGNVSGCIGETSKLALLIGGVYLLVRKVIDWKVPLIFIATVALFSLIFAKDINAVLPNILGGGLFLGAIFMATDYSTSPNTAIGTIIFAFGCGLLTTIIRVFGNYPEGVSFAILLMNLVTPLLDKYIVPRPFGFVKPKKEAKA